MAASVRTIRIVSNTARSASRSILPAIVFEAVAADDRREARSFPYGEGHMLSNRMRYHQDVGEQDRRIETETADWL